MKPHQFTTLLEVRWSPVVGILPPLVSYQLRQATERFTVLNEIRSWGGRQ